jgi:hypothetical protein
MNRALALLPMALVLAACGGGGGGGGGEADVRAAEQEIPGEEYTAEYTQGIASCTSFPLEQLARDFHVKAENKAVARAVAKSIEPKPGKKQEDAYHGCLTVLRAPPG